VSVARGNSPRRGYATLAPRSSHASTNASRSSSYGWGRSSSMGPYRAAAPHVRSSPGVGRVRGGSCPRWVLSEVGCVRGGSCPRWVVSEVGRVQGQLLSTGQGTVKYVLSDSARECHAQPLAPRHPTSLNVPSAANACMHTCATSRSPLLYGRTLVATKHVATRARHAAVPHTKFKLKFSTIEGIHAPHSTGSILSTADRSRPVYLVRGQCTTSDVTHVAPTIHPRPTWPRAMHRAATPADNAALT